MNPRPSPTQVGAFERERIAPSIVVLRPSSALTREQGKPMQLPRARRVLLDRGGLRRGLACHCDGEWFISQNRIVHRSAIPCESGHR
jgi:hypothetical protein